MNRNKLLIKRFVGYCVRLCIHFIYKFKSHTRTTICIILMHDFMFVYEIIEKCINIIGTDHQKSFKRRLL